MLSIWDNVIVSDDSIFKLISQLRKIFTDAGLPNDSITNVYGKGYQVKVKIDKVENINNLEEQTELKKPSRKSLRNKIIAVTLICLFVIAFVFYFNRNSTNEELPNFVTKQHKLQIADLQKQDWQKSFDFVNTMLTEKIEVLSKNDLAYLYDKKGVAEIRLQNFNDALTSFNHAVLINTHLKNFQALGENHLHIADYYDFHKNRSKKINHLEKAVLYFNKVNSVTDIIDAQIELASTLRQHNKFQQSIQVYESTIAFAEKHKDIKGKMIAVNNLASTYKILNQTKKALKLGEHGLELCLELGDAQGIANSYSFLSSLYQEDYQTLKAVKMIESALEYQIKINDYMMLPPKLFNLSFLLVKTYQYENANIILQVTSDFANALGAKTLVLLTQYQGMNEAHKLRWLKAQELLQKSLNKSKSNGYKFNENLTMAYLALAYYFNNHQIKASEMAIKVINNQKSKQQAKAIASLALAYSYNFMENKVKTNEWIIKTRDLLENDWLFVRHLFLSLQLEIANQQDLDDIPQLIKQIEDIQLQIQELSNLAKIDKELFEKLVNHVQKHISKLNKIKKSE